MFLKWLHILDYKICVEYILVFKENNFLGIPISLSIAMMSFVGSEMGKGNTKRAKFYVAAGLAIFAVSCAICSILIWFF